MTDGCLAGQENWPGVSVSIDGDEVYIELFVILGYGIKISEVARMIVDKVRYTVRSLPPKSKKVTVNVEHKASGEFGELTMTCTLRRRPVQRHAYAVSKYLSDRKKEVDALNVFQYPIGYRYKHVPYTFIGC